MFPSSRKITSIAAALALFGHSAGLSTLSGSAYAADMLADDDTYEYTNVEFGTGWYLRGDIGAALTEVTVETDFTYGESELGSPITIGLAAGYTFAEGLRAEIGLNHFNDLAFSTRASYPNCGTEDHDGDANTPPISVTGNCFISVNAQVNASSIMANGYADLGTYWGIRPYVGAGVGVAYLSWNDFTFNDYCEGTQNSDCGQSGGVGLQSRYQGNYTTQNAFTYAANAMLGVSYELTRNTTLDLGYRFTYIGEAGVARAADNPGIYQDLTVGDIMLHEIRAGFRYEIW